MTIHSYMGGGGGDDSVLEEVIKTVPSGDRTIDSLHGRQAYPKGAIFVPSPPKTGIDLQHPPPPPIVERLFFPCPRSRLRIWSREAGPAVPSRVILLIPILRLNLVLTHGIPPEFHDGVLIFVSTAIRHRISPEFIGSRDCVSIAFTAPRVRRHRASKPQGSSKRVLPWQVTMDQSICASLSHIQYWYEVGIC